MSETVIVGVLIAVFAVGLVEVVRSKGRSLFAWGLVAASVVAYVVVV